MSLITEKQTVRICLKCGDMFLASAAPFMLSSEKLCEHCEMATGFFLNDCHLKEYITRYKPDLSKIRNQETRRTIIKFIKGVK